MKTVLTFNGGMDQDTSPMYIKKGDVTERRNARITVGSGLDEYVNKSLQDTVFHQRSLPDGFNKTVGWCKYEEQNSVIYFNYNSAGNHGIYMFNLVTKVNSLLLQTPILEFDEHTVVKARVIGEEVVWVTIRTGRVIDPRIISIPRALNYSSGTAVSGLIWRIEDLTPGSIQVTVYEDTVTPATGSLAVTVYEDTIIIPPDVTPEYGNIQVTVYEDSTYSTVTGTIIRNT